MTPAVEGVQQAHARFLVIGGAGLDDRADEHLEQAAAHGVDQHGDEQPHEGIARQIGQHGQADKANG